MPLKDAQRPYLSAKAANYGLISVQEINVLLPPPGMILVSHVVMLAVMLRVSEWFFLNFQFKEKVKKSVKKVYRG